MSRYLRLGSTRNPWPAVLMAIHLSFLEITYTSLKNTINRDGIFRPLEH
jgi:hypothetical protein